MSTTMRKPRRNDEAITFWVDQILKDEVGPSFDVNSIHLDGDTIYHYGRHYPMATIIRKVPRLPKGQTRRFSADDGPTIAVLINSTRWGGASGFGQSTDAVVNGLRSEIKSACKGTDIKVYEYPLTSPKLANDDRFKAEESEDDPEPDVMSKPELATVPTSRPINPGPEPIKDDHGCIAGTRDDFEAAEECTIYISFGSGTVLPTDVVVRVSEHGDVTVRRWMNASIEYTETNTYGNRKSQHAKIQCPHCAAHDRKMTQWRTLYFGGHNYQTGTKVRLGWKAYSANLEVFGDEYHWGQARFWLHRIWEAQVKAHDEWMGRNTMSWGSLPKKVWGNVVVVDIDPETGRVPRKIFLKHKRNMAAAQRRHEADVRRRARADREAAKERKAAREAIVKRIAKKRAEWEENGVDLSALSDNVVDWLASHGLAPNSDGTVRLVKRVQTHFIDGYRAHAFTDPVEKIREGKAFELRSRAGNQSFVYPTQGYVQADDYEPNERCGAGLHFSATFKEATEVFYGDTMIECDVDLATMFTIWDNKVKAESCTVVRIVPEDEWKAAQA